MFLCLTTPRLAARAAALTEIDPPRSGIVTSKVFDNCMLMARHYRSKRSATDRLNQHIRKDVYNEGEPADLPFFSGHANFEIGFFTFPVDLRFEAGG